MRTVPLLRTVYKNYSVDWSKFNSLTLSDSPVLLYPY